MSGNPIEPLPRAVAWLFAALLVGTSGWLVLTGFHPRWRRVVRWGRMQKGPPLSRAGHVILAMAAFAWGVGALAYSVQILAFPHVADVMAVITGAAVIGIFVHDSLTWK